MDFRRPGLRRSKWTDPLLHGRGAGTPGVLDAVTRREALLADAGTTKQGRVGSTRTKSFTVPACHGVTACFSETHTACLIQRAALYKLAT